MANYPFKINIDLANADAKEVYSFYTASFATDADAVVSSSVIVDRINGMKRQAKYINSIEDGGEEGGPLLYGNTDEDGIKFLSASFTEPNTGSITFTDTESTSEGGLEYYTFWGTKVCSVLGLPEGIKIRTENFKLSDNTSDSDNYVSGDLISNNIQLKEGFKMAPQARMRSNLIWDDAFGEGFVQWVSGSTRRAFLGYDDTKDLYSLLVSQVTSSAIKATTFTGNLTGIASSATTTTNLNGGSVTLGEDEVIQSKIGNETGDDGHKLILSASLNQLGNGGDIILQGGHNAGGAANLSGLDIRGGHVIVRPGDVNLSVGGAFTEADSSPGSRTAGSFIVSGSTTIASKNTGDLGGTSLKLGDSTSTYNNWISIRCQDGDETSSGGITFYETSTFSVSAPRYGAKIVYDENTDDFKIGTMHDNTFKKQITFPRQNARIEILGSVLPVTDDTYDLGASSFRWDDVYATNGTINTSDRNLKTQISGSDLGLDFINDLNPVKYQWISGSRPHYGLIAQEVSSSLAKSSVSTDNFAGYVENRMFISGSVSGSEKDIRDAEDWEMKNFTSIPNPKLSLRYNEFISPMIKAIQELSSQVESLKTQISGSG